MACFKMRYDSIGRLIRPKHGEVKNGKPSVEYRVWSWMIERCYNKNNKNYRYYGGRGIRVCRRWVISVSSFIEDIGRRPGSNYTLERKDTNKNYSPSNCKWATRLEQNRNKRDGIRFVFNGKVRTILEISVLVGKSYGATYQMYRRKQL